MRTKKRATSETEPLDPVALALAIWLGTITSVIGLAQFSQRADARRLAAREAATQAHGGEAGAAEGRAKLVGRAAVGL